MHHEKVISDIYDKIFSIKNKTINNNSNHDLYEMKINEQINSNSRKIYQLIKISFLLEECEAMTRSYPALLNDSDHLRSIIGNILHQKRETEEQYIILKNDLIEYKKRVKENIKNNMGQNNDLNNLINTLLNFLIIPKKKLENEYHNEICGISLSPLIEHKKIFRFYGCGHLFGMCDFIKKGVKNSWENNDKSFICPFCRSNELSFLLQNIKKICEGNDNLKIYLTDNFIKKIH